MSEKKRKSGNPTRRIWVRSIERRNSTNTKEKEKAKEKKVAKV